MLIALVAVVLGIVGIEAFDKGEIFGFSELGMWLES
jgi:hypothetical protein